MEVAVTSQILFTLGGLAALQTSHFAGHGENLDRKRKTMIVHLVLFDKPRLAA
jgi:hypothetical protein